MVSYNETRYNIDLYIKSLYILNHLVIVCNPRSKGLQTKEENKTIKKIEIIVN